MSIEKYFEQEYNYLQVAGKEFAERHKTLGSKLKLSERERKDPFVERLFEGFAFLAGRIHERLDDELPEITGGLLEQLFPHLLRPFPSCAILEARPRAGTITKPIILPRGGEIQTATGQKYKIKRKTKASPGASDAARESEKVEPAEFIFRTTQELIVRPMRLKAVRVEETPETTSAVILQIQPDRNVNYEALALNKLRLYLHGAASVKYTLLLFLIKYAKSLAVRELPGTPTRFQKVESFHLSIPGLSDGDDRREEVAILPYARQSFTGYRLLQEYFAFPERFFFVDIQGLDNFAASRDGHPFEIQITFDRKLARERHPGLENILLHCTPIVNLFDRETEEVAVTQRMPEYYLIPDLDRRWSREIYAIKKVTGIGENKLEQYKYLPVTSYDILDATDPDYEYKRFYAIVRRLPSEQGAMADTYIRLFGPSLEQAVFPKETLSLEAILCNGSLPPSYLEVGAIKEPINFPPGIEASNLTVPTEVLEGPQHQNYLWALISHLTLSYSTLAETETLKSILSLYNWSPAHNNPNKKRIQGMIKVLPPVAKNLFYQRSLIRGVEFKLEVEPQAFENGEGDIYLFGLVLNRFLAQYVTINSVVFLTIVEAGTGKEYKWEPNAGQILPV